MANIAVAHPVVPHTVPTTWNEMAFNFIQGDVLGHKPTKGISGHVYDTNGDPVQDVTVLLIRQHDNAHVATQQTLANGTYYFDRDTADTNTYFTIAYTLAGGNVQVHGTSDRGLVPV